MQSSWGHQNLIQSSEPLEITNTPIDAGRNSRNWISVNANLSKATMLFRHELVHF